MAAETKTRGKVWVHKETILLLDKWGDENIQLYVWQCEEWYIHKTGFIEASKCKRFSPGKRPLKKMKEMSKSWWKILCYPLVTTQLHVVKIKKRNHKILEIEDYFMRRVHVGHISKLPAIPTTN